MADLTSGLSGATVPAVFQHTVATCADQPALRRMGAVSGMSWGDCGAEVRRIAGGLAGLGVGPGDTVALLLRNQPEFNLIDIAALHLGATPWSIYLSSAASQIQDLLARSGSRVVVCDPAYRERLESALSGTKVEHVVEVASPPALPPAPVDFDFDAGWRAVSPDSAVTLIWTSGTTGEPKQVELTHRSVLATARSLTAVSEVGTGGRLVSYLPAAHTGDRLLSHYWWIVLGAELTCIPDAAQVMQALPSVRPTIWGTVPRIFEKLRASLESGGVTDPATLSPAEAAAIRHRLGLDQAEFLMVGAAPLAADTLRYFDALGLPVSEVWGMSETSGLLTINPPGARKYGTVGPPMPGSEVALASDGEVLVRGPGLMRAYRDQPDLTAETLVDGWLHTGDIGTIDEDGYLSIVDRKKDLIINAAGKNMSPAAIENALKTAGQLIGQACVIGDGRSYNVALLVLDPDAAAVWARAHHLDGCGLADLVQTPELLADVATEVGLANSALSRVEQIKAWRLLPTDWQANGGELTPTMKLKRRSIADTYRVEIDALYS